ncbi:MAG: hypothetical protein H6737_02550 [Alphaproteobacteria bacterium]|nr:hypothetical protein [Alphaproteobacteria bacterium]
MREVSPGALQLASGLVNAWCMGGIAWALCGNVCGAATSGFGSLGGLCGWAACLLVPLGWVEIFVGLRALRTGDVRWSRRLAVVEIASIVIGGLPAAVVGAAVLVTASSRSPAAPG